MKTKLAGLALLLFIINLPAQNSRIGAYTMPMVSSAEIMTPTSREPEWRTIGTNILNANFFTGIEGRTSSTSGDITFVDASNPRREIAVKHLTGDITQGRYLYFRASRIGIYQDGTAPLEEYDCGTVPTRPEMEQKEHADYLLEKQEAARLERIRAAAQTKAANQKSAALAKALTANQKAADAGDAYGLLRMGERYRDGEGVEKNLIKAREYLQKAAAAGSTTASNELSTLNP